MILVHHKACKPLFYAAYSKIKRHFSLVVLNNEDLKMQTYDTAHPAQHHQNTTGYKFIAVFSLAVFLVYAVQNHLITEAFSYALSLLFDNFSVKSSSIIADVVILIFLALALFGLWILFVNFTTFSTITAALLIAAAVYFGTDETDHKKIKLTDNAKKEKFIEPNHKFDGIGG